MYSNKMIFRFNYVIFLNTWCWVELSLQLMSHMLLVQNSTSGIKEDDETKTKRTIFLLYTDHKDKFVKRLP